jgi:hypothetical protein
MLVMQQLVAQVGLRTFERYKLAPPIAAAVEARVPKEARILAVKFGEPTLVFELWPRRIEMTGAAEAIDSWKLETGPGVLIAPEALVAPHGFEDEARYETVLRFEGFNYSTGDWMTLMVVGRDFPKN